MGGFQRKDAAVNILYIAHESRLGGPNKSLLEMIDQLSGENTIYVVVPIKRGFLVDELHKRNIPVIYQHSFWWMIAPGGNMATAFVRKWIYRVLVLHNYVCAWRLRKVVRQQEIDMIHTNSSVLNTGGILASMVQIPHVWHIRELRQEGLGFIDVWQPARISRFMEEHSSRIVAISKAVRDKYAEQISGDLISVVYNGVGEENLYEKELEKHQGDTVNFLISGRVSGEKRQEEAIRAVALLTEAGYRNLHLSIAGPGDTDKLCSLIADRKIEEYVTFLGYRSDLPLLRREMDVELVCSLWEAFGRVTVEAMMSSNPVIGADSGGTPELIKDGENGYLYRQGDERDLADKMRRFMKHPERIRRMGKCAYQTAKAQFSSKRNAERMLEIYRELMR